MMIYFNSDYVGGCLPEIMDALVHTNDEKLTGYGSDKYTVMAVDAIQLACESPRSEVCFVSGGTQANQFVISNMLRSYEGVICADTGHINVHEAGAIEYTGHKVLPVPTENGKILLPQLQEYLETFYNDPTYEHMVVPGMVYISQPTELGSLYSLAELQRLRTICDTYHLHLFVDGARLGYALAAKENDVTLPQLATLTDVFYIGGTKVGTLNGEAIVFNEKALPSMVMTRIKQHGALLAKGRLLGVQFYTLFKDGLYYRAGEHGMQQAHALRHVLAKHHIPLYADSPTNQQFIVLPKEQALQLLERVGCEKWCDVDADRMAIRLVTSWSTTDADITTLDAIFTELL